MTEFEVSPRPQALRFLPQFLFDNRRSPLGYIPKAWLLVFLPSAVLAAVVNTLAPAAEQPELGSGWPMLFGVILFAPFVETLIMAGVIQLLSRFLSAPLTAVASAAGWGVAHSLAAPIWGLVIWWPFLIFSLAYLTWRPHGFWKAVAIVTAIHALQNAFPALLMFLTT